MLLEFIPFTSGRAEMTRLIHSSFRRLYRFGRTLVVPHETHSALDHQPSNSHFCTLPRLVDLVQIFSSVPIPTAPS